MICNKIKISDFRNIETADVSFGDGINILVGQNAQGKTNLLEAIYYTALGKSFRTSHDEDMIRFGQKIASLSMDFTDSQRLQNITVRLISGKPRQIEQNHVKLHRVSEIVGQFRTVLFCPEHLSLIKNGPSERRNFLDVAISQLYPVYLKCLQRYNKNLKQRNQLIKTAVFDRKTFDATVEAWSSALAREAAVISQYRYRYLKEANGEIVRCFSEMTGGKEVPQAIYRGSSGQDPDEYEDVQATEQAYFNLLTQRTEQEIRAGSTLYGIHKDDVEILLNGKPARMFASQGQQRSLALAMKLAEGEVCSKICGELPSFLFDDVFSELDESRRTYLSSKISGRQVIISSCEPGNLGEQARIIDVKNGVYLPRNE